VRPDRRDEDAWIAAVAGRFSRSPRVLVGPGDDAAVVRLDGRDVVLKTDTVVDGVDFRLAECGAKAAGRKAVAVVVSDFAAMAAVPRACVVSAVLPVGVEFETFDGLAEGLAEAASEFGCEVVGGDTSVAPGPLTLAVAGIGEPGPDGVVLRTGARAGDALSVTGPLGGSLLGRHLTFRPRVAEALALARARVAHAMMDLSDGLSTDVARLCAASGVGADLVAEDVPVHPDALRAGPPRGPLERALHDGEDFELLVAHGPLDAATEAGLARAGVVLHRIGTVTANRGVVRLLRDGHATRLEPGGYDHLARSAT
jgi:thiamine-monophosphate kinase